MIASVDHSSKQAKKLFGFWGFTRENVPLEQLNKYDRDYLAYEFARQDPPWGHGVFHGFMRMGTKGVFWWHSWARTETGAGPAFGICPRCFAGRDPLLFYALGEVPVGLPLAGLRKDASPDWSTEVYEIVRDCSGGIRLEGLRGQAILFRLDERNI